MDSVGKCIVGIWWLLLLLPTAVLCLCVSPLSSRVLQVACCVHERQMEYIGADNVPQTLIYRNVA